MLHLKSSQLSSRLIELKSFYPGITGPSSIVLMKALTASMSRCLDFVFGKSPFNVLEILRLWASRRSTLGRAGPSMNVMRLKWDCATKVRWLVLSSRQCNCDILWQKCSLELGIGKIVCLVLMCFLTQHSSLKKRKRLSDTFVLFSRKNKRFVCWYFLSLL